MHCDLNNFYASVECVTDPTLKDKYVAVCGRQEDRHGIVLAKNQKAKEMGVTTGEVIWQAKKKCPQLIIVRPDFDKYAMYSQKVRKIYERYTDQVEPFGMDECWLDVTGSTKLFGSGYEIADEIRRTVKKETGLTISVGVSFNKIFAKLGSDMKKPDAVTEITPENFRQKIGDLNANEMLGVGRATKAKLNKHCIHTIGQLADTDVKLLQKLLGKCGTQLWIYANGLDCSRVMPCEYVREAKSIGHGITATSDLVSNDEVWRVMLALTQDIAYKLRKSKMRAIGVQISIRDNTLFIKEYQGKLQYSSQNAYEISKKAFELFRANYKWTHDIRSVTVRAIDLVPQDVSEQYCLGYDFKHQERISRIDKAIDAIRERYGNNSICSASLMHDLKMPYMHPQQSVLPSPMFK